MRELFHAVAVPLARPDFRDAFYRGWRLMSLDASGLEVAPTEENRRSFAPAPGSEVDATARLQLAGVAECGTHALVGAVAGPPTMRNERLALDLLDRLEPGMLCFADQSFSAFPLFKRARATGAELCWRARESAALEATQRLGDGSFLSVYYQGPRDRQRKTSGTVVRVIDYADLDGRAPRGARFRLLTTILDETAAPAAELAAAYAHRWEFASTLRELEVNEEAAGPVLRSKVPVGVVQEAYACLCVHYAIRSTMTELGGATAHSRERFGSSFPRQAVRRTTASHPRSSA